MATIAFAEWRRPRASSQPWPGMDRRAIPVMVGPRLCAQFSSLGGLAADTSGNLYIADNFNNRIRMVSAATGIITTVAGSGVVGSAGDGGLAANAELNNPLSVAVDTAGDLYIADSGNYRIRKVTVATGTIETAWNGSAVYRNSQP